MPKKTMNFDELNKIVAEKAGLHICPICGIPFSPYHSRQKTCGTDNCKRLYHNKYCDSRRRMNLSEHPEEFRAYRREAERKYRRKKREKEAMARNYDKLEAYWEKQGELKAQLLDGGLDYGKRQVEKTLAQVPKIDVSGFERREDR